MGPGSKLLHFVSLTDIFITLGATIETSSLHVNNNSSTGPLIWELLRNGPQGLKTKFT